MSGIGPYLYKEHVYSVLQLFPPLENEIIRSTTWEPETGEVVLDSESMADKFLDETLED